MPKLTTQVSEILVTNQSTAKGFADTFVFEPAEDKEIRFGKLIILISFTQKTKKTPEISEAIASIMQNSYYQESNREPEEQFEGAVKRVNEVLGDLASAGEVSWVGQLNSVIVAFSDDQIFISSVGNAKAYIIRRSHLSQLNKDTSSVPVKPNPLKTYQNIISGQADLGDKFVFLSPKVLDYIEKPKVKEIVTRFTPDIAARHLHSRLISFKDKDSFAALVAGITESGTKETTPKFVSESPDRPSKRGSSKQRTPQKASAAATGALARTSGIFKSLAGKTADTTKNRILPLLGRKNKSGTKPVAKSARSPQKHNTKSSQPISSRKPFTYTDTRPKPWWKKFSTMLRNVGKEIIHRFSKWFGKLPRTSKILFIVVIILLIAFLISLAAVQGNKDTQAKRAFYESRTDEALTKEEEAEAAIIYGNGDKARQLLEEAKIIAEEVQNSKYPSDEASAILKQIEDDHQRLDHINQVNDPEKIIDLSELGNGVNPTDLTLSSNKLVSYNPNPGSLYIYDTDSKQLKAVEVEPGGNIQSLTSDDKEIALTTTAPALVRYDFEGYIASEASSDLDDGQNLRAVFLFGNRLYALDPGKNEIQKMSTAIGGFSKGSNWLNEDVDLSQGIDLAIDGAIYVLNSDGSITKLLRGYRNDFNISNLSTPLVNPTHIFTNDETNKIYILDPQNNRLVELDKDGNLINQYLSDKFTNLRGMAINEEAKKAYLLNGTEILGIKLAD